MGKYYRRLTWGLILLLTAIAVVFVVFLTRQEAKRVMQQRDSVWMDIASQEMTLYSKYITDRVQVAYDENEPTWPWDSVRLRTIATEAVWYSLANMGNDSIHLMDSGSDDIAWTYRQHGCGFAGDLILDGERLNIPMSFLMLFEGWPVEKPLFAVVPESFFELESYWWGPNEITPARIFNDAPQCHIVGKRYENTVYIDTIEFFIQGDEILEDAYWKYDLSYDGVEVPKDAQPCEFTSTQFKMHVTNNTEFNEREYYYAEYYDLNYTKHYSDWRKSAERDEIKRIEDAEKKLNRKLEEQQKSGDNTSMYVNDYSLSEMNIWGYDRDYIGFAGMEFLSFAFVYTFYPLKEARESLEAVYNYTFLFLVAAILIVLFLIRSLRRNQERYERSRLAMTRSVAHELKTPLAVTKSYVENWEDFDEAQREEYSRKMVSQIDYVSDLVHDLLELSRMEAGAKEINREPVNLAELNELVLRQMEDLAATRNITVDLPEDRESLTVQADLSLMRTVLMNLVSNAIRYSAENIKIEICKKRDKVRYSITNDGDPIPAEKIGLIWEEFYRTDDARSDRAGGSGLGLAITRQIFLLHGAWYGCTSGEGGTTFFFEL